MAKDGWAHLVLMAALERVDDTALLRKHIIAELMVRLSVRKPGLPQFSADRAEDAFSPSTPNLAAFVRVVNRCGFGT